LYTVPVSEMIAVLKDGTEITYALYEKRKAEAGTKVKEAEVELPRLQKSLFPDFEEDFASKKDVEISLSDDDDDIPLSEITIKDLAAIMLMKPVSKKEWLNDLVKQAKTEL
jgi:transcriptional regulator